MQPDGKSTGDMAPGLCVQQVEARRRSGGFREGDGRGGVHLQDVAGGEMCIRDRENTASPSLQDWGQAPSSRKLPEFRPDESRLNVFSALALGEMCIRYRYIGFRLRIVLFILLVVLSFRFAFLNDFFTHNCCLLSTSRCV